MKTEEDEAFEAIERKQGGFQAKRKAAADKLQEPVARVSGTYGGRFVYDPINRAAILPVGMALYAMPPQPAQEPPSEWAGIKAILDEYGLQAIDFVADFKAALAQPAQERPWVGLTDEETSGFTQHEMTVVKYVSKVLQEKNT